MMKPDSDDVREIEEAVSAEGEPRFIAAPAEVIPLESEFPFAWVQLLKSADLNEHAISSVWNDAVEYMPKVVSEMCRKVQSVGLLLTKTMPPSLVYLFLKNGELFARRGFLPVDHLPEISQKLPVDLLSVYRIHNGWLDLFSGDTGPSRTEDWNVIGESRRGAGDGFLEVFATGTSALGFDLSENPAEPNVIWSDGDVELVDDFWSRLDEWIAAELRGMDDRDTQ
jgi:hypothetical protein